MISLAEAYEGAGQAAALLGLAASVRLCGWYSVFFFLTSCAAVLLGMGASVRLCGWCSVYVLCWYKGTNADAGGAGRSKARQAEEKAVALAVLSFTSTKVQIWTQKTLHAAHMLFLYIHICVCMYKYI